MGTYFFQIYFTFQGDWWVDAVVLGRLARLATTFHGLRLVHRPLLAWWDYILYRRGKQKIIKLNQTQIALSSWRFRTSFRNPRKQHIWRGGTRLERLLMKRISVGWRSLSQPIFLARQAKRARAISSLLRNRMLMELARCFRRQKLLHYWLVVWDIAKGLGGTKQGGKKKITDEKKDDTEISELFLGDEKVRADVEAAIARVEAQTSPMGAGVETSSSLVEQALLNIDNPLRAALGQARGGASKGFCTYVKRRAWMRWQRSIQVPNIY